MKLVFSPLAYQDLNRLYSFIRQVSPTALKKASRRLEQSFRMLKKYPRAGYPLGHLPPFRELLIPFGKGSYVIRYRIEKQTVFVVHLWHSRENRPVS